MEGVLAGLLPGLILGAIAAASIGLSLAVECGIAAIARRLRSRTQQSKSVDVDTSILSLPKDEPR